MRKFLFYRTFSDFFGHFCLGGKVGSLWLVAVEKNFRHFRPFPAIFHRGGEAFGSSGGRGKYCFFAVFWWILVGFAAFWKGSSPPGARPGRLDFCPRIDTNFQGWWWKKIPPFSAISRHFAPVCSRSFSERDAPFGRPWVILRQAQDERGYLRTSIGRLSLPDSFRFFTLFRMTIFVGKASE